MIDVPQYQELSVCKIWNEVKEDEELMMYFLDEYPDGKYPDRRYFYYVLNTLYPDFVTRLINHAQEVRNTSSKEEEKAEVIEIAPEWMEELAAFPFKSSKFYLKFLSNIILGKGGRTMALLKRGSKKRNTEKKRKEVPIIGSFA